MTKKNEFKLRLNIHGYACSEGEVTKILGIEPSESWCEGDPVVPGALNRHDENGWRLNSALSTSHSLNEHWIALREQLEIIASKRDLLPPEVVVEISCIVYVYENLPSIFFDEDQIELMARLESELDIDIYNLAE